MSLQEKMLSVDDKVLVKGSSCSYDEKDCILTHFGAPTQLKLSRFVKNGLMNTFRFKILKSQTFDILIGIQMIKEMDDHQLFYEWMY